MPNAQNDVAPYWQIEAKRILRAELDRRSVTYARLAVLLNGIGVTETERAIANKVSRGSFSFVFFLQVMRALGATSVSVEPVQSSSRIPYTEIREALPPASREELQPVVRANH